MTNGNGHQQVRLRFIYRCDFRKSEATHFEEVKRHAKELDLKKDDCILMLSSNGKVLRFVFAPDEMVRVDSRGNTMDEQVRILPSRSYRILGGGTFSGYTLANYAEKVGLSLKGLKKLEEHISHEREAERSSGERLHTMNPDKRQMQLLLTAVGT